MENSIKTILLTWWTWFIWSHLLDRLLFLDYKIILLKRNNSDIWRIRNILWKNLDNVIIVDLDKTNIENIFESNKIDIILHLATLYKKNHSINDLHDMIDSNVSFPSLLCESSIKYWVKYFINTWTFFEYEHIKDKNNVLDELSKEKPYNLYASTKLAFNDILKFYTQNYDFKAINLRLFSPYWPKDNEKLIPLIIKSVLQNKELKLSWWEQKLTFTYVDDIVEAYVKSILYIESMVNKYEVFNIWYNQPIAIKDIIETMKDIWSNTAECIKLWASPYWNNEIFYSASDTTKAKELLHWSPKYDIKEWISLTYNYYKNEV
jgi:nucleoside-diphosphate-sugar epimerase